MLNRKPGNEHVLNTNSKIRNNIEKGTWNWWWITMKENFAMKHHQMCETHNCCLGLKQGNTTLYKATTDNHKCGKRATT